MQANIVQQGETVTKQTRSDAFQSICTTSEICILQL